MPPPENCSGCTPKTRGQRGQNAPRSGAGRGVSYWSSTDGSDQRIIYVTPGYRMIALNAKTGVPISTFGQDGVVDLKLENDQELDLVTAELGLNSTPLVAGDVVVVGAAQRFSGAPRTMNNAKGYVRGFDVKTGKRLWIFHTIPKPGEFGYDTWENDSALKNGNNGVWAQMSADLELGLVYCPSKCRRAIITAATGRATRCSTRASSRSTSRPGSANGTTRSSITAYGITIFPARPSSSTSR